MAQKKTVTIYHPELKTTSEVLPSAVRAWEVAGWVLHTEAPKYVQKAIEKNGSFQPKEAPETLPQP